MEAGPRVTLQGMRAPLEVVLAGIKELLLLSSSSRLIVLLALRPGPGGKSFGERRGIKKTGGKRRGPLLNQWRRSDPMHK